MVDGAASNTPTIAFAHVEFNNQESGAGAIDIHKHSAEVVDSLQEAGAGTADMSPWATETMVKFGVLLPEAKSIVKVAAQRSSHKTDEGFKAEEIQAQNARSSSAVVQVRHEQGQKESSVSVTAAADDGGGLQQLSDALIDR